MKIGLLITSVSNFGANGFYNSQEIGLAKKLSEIFEDVIIYKLVGMSNDKSEYTVQGFENIIVKIIPSKNYGINGILNLHELADSLDVLVYFSDTQLSVPRVYKWCKKNNVIFIPYIGVIESHSHNKVKKLLIDYLFSRNLAVYKKCTCLAKTPQVQQSLAGHGVQKVRVAPAGIDLTLLNHDYKSSIVSILKKKWGYSEADRVLLFIGRLAPEKQPLKLVDIFEKILRVDSNFRLLIVGIGELKSELILKIRNMKLEERVRMIDKISNSDIWELYRIADTFINLNQQEIFGMAILEAMFYECKVVAWEAPGPNFTIKNRISGFIVSSEDEIIECVLSNYEEIKDQAHRRVVEFFTWGKTANEIVSLVSV